MPSPLDEKLQSIEDRLSRIEARLNIPPTTAQIPSSAIFKPQEPQPIPQEYNVPPSVPHPDQSESDSGKLLGIIAIVCFVLAGGFIIKLSINSGWLTPARQIGIAALFGFSLIGLGLKLLNVDREYASYLPAAGIIVLFLATFAAHRYYFLIPFSWAIISTAVVSLICIGLYLRIRHDIYPVIASIGAYLAPLILTFNDNTDFSLYYFVLCSITFSALSIWLNTRILTVISAYLAMLTTAYVGFYLHQDKLIVQTLALQFIIFSIATFFYSRIRGQALTEKEAWDFFPVLLFFYGTEYYFMSLINVNFAAWASLGFAAFLICLHLLQKKIFSPEQSAGSEKMIFTFAAIVFFYSGYFVLLPDAAGPWLLVAILLLLSFLPARYATADKNILLFTPIILVVWLIMAIEYAKIALGLYDLTSYQPTSWPAIFFAIVSIWVLFIRQHSYLMQKQDFGYALLCSAHLLVILSLYRLADPHGSLAVSALWLAYATAVIIFGFIRKDKIMANSALLVLFISAAKALLYDAASAPSTVRIVCLVLTGAVFYGAGLLYRQIAKWQS